MAVSYKKLFHLMIEKEMTNAQLQQKAGFSANIITRLKRNETISMESLESICKALVYLLDDIYQSFSIIKLWVQRFQLNPGICRLELPIHLGIGIIALTFPYGKLLSKLLDGRDPAGKTLPCHDI